MAPAVIGMPDTEFLSKLTITRFRTGGPHESRTFTQTKVHQDVFEEINNKLLKSSVLLLPGNKDGFKLF